MENKPWGDEWLPEPGQRRTMDRIHSILSRYDQKLPQADLDMLKFKLDCIRKDLYNIVSNFNYYDEPIPLYKKVFNEYAYCLKMV